MFMVVFFVENDVNAKLLQEMWLAAQSKFPEFLRTRAEMVNWITEDTSTDKLNIFVKTLTGKTLHVQ